MGKEFFRHDTISIQVTILDDNIIRIRAGGMDGYQDSLLNRYGFFEVLQESDVSWQNNMLELPDNIRLQFNTDLSFVLSRGEQTILQTGAEYIPGTACTHFQNRGYLFSAPMSVQEKLIGMGDQYRHGFLLNGQKESLWIRNQSDYVPVPFFMSSSGYGILFNTSRRLYYDFGVSNPDEYTIRVAEEYMDIYIFTAKPFDYWSLIERYTRLTGRPQLPPRYTFGLWMVAHTEIRAHELLQLALEMRRAEIPCDILALEPLWMEKLYDESLEKNWNSERFPFFPWAKRDDTFIGDLKQTGFHFGLWMLSNYDHTWAEEHRLKDRGMARKNNEKEIVKLEYLQLAENDEHFGHYPMLMDKISKPDEPYFEHLKKFVDQGVDYFKQDGYAQINTHPDRLYGNGYGDDIMHNIHYMIYTKQMVNGIEEQTGRRGFTMAVAGWTGFQRFAGTWTGDTGGGDQSLCAILQLSTVGHAFSTCDMEVDSPEGIHMGFLLPWTQLCSWSYFKYPVYKGELIQSIFRSYDNLRMQLLPFYYSLAREACSSGKAIARPLHLCYPTVAKAYELRNQFMIGDALLVGTYTESIVLPEGQWFDYWHNQIIAGEWQKLVISYPVTRGGQLLVKAGAIIPLMEIQQYVGEKELKKLTWQIFPGAVDSEFELYWDDGISFEYRQNKYASAKLFCRSSQRRIEIFWGEITGESTEFISVLDGEIELLGVTDVIQATLNGKQHKFTVNEGRGRTYIPGFGYGDRLLIEINHCEIEKTKEV